MAFDLGVVGIRIPKADSLARDIARKLVQRQRNPEALFAGHPAVAGDLFLESKSWVHRLILLPTMEVRARSSPSASGLTVVHPTAMGVGVDGLLR